MSLLSDPGLPSRVGTSVFERPGLVLSNLLRMDPEAAARAIFAPQGLAPSERRTLADEIGIGSERSLSGFAIRTLTNPLVIAGVVLGMRYPIPRAQEMFQFAKHLSGMERKLGPLKRVIGNVDEIYAGLPIPEDYKHLLYTVDGFKQKYAGKLGQAVVKAEKAGLKWDQRTQVLLAAKLDGLDRLTAAGPAFMRNIKEGPAFDSLVKDARGIFHGLWDDMFGTASKIATLKSKAAQSLIPAGDRKALMAALRGKEGTAEALGLVGYRTGRGAKTALGKLEGLHKKKIHGMMRANFFGEVDQFARLDKIGHYWPHRLAPTAEQFARQTQEMIRQAGLKIGNITEKSANIDLMIDCQDPLYAQVKECLPEGTKIGDYVVSVDITVLKD